MFIFQYTRTAGYNWFGIIENDSLRYLDSGSPYKARWTGSPSEWHSNVKGRHVHSFKLELVY